MFLSMFLPGSWKHVYHPNTRLRLINLPTRFPGKRGHRNFDHSRNSDSIWNADHPGLIVLGIETLTRICIATLHDIAHLWIILVLSTNPPYKLTGTERQAAKQTNQHIGRYASPKTLQSWNLFYIPLQNPKSEIETFRNVHEYLFSFN